jgi:hypothetical protein
MKLQHALLAVALATTSSMMAAPAAAQIAAALGRPLPVASDPNGTVAVRVVHGDPGKPAVGIDVTLEIGGTPRVARTDASGRATFTGLTAGAAAQVKIAGSDGELASQPFTVPPSGGVRLIMSTTGKFGGASADSGAAAASDGPGMGGGKQPTLRERSGGVISNAGAPADSLTIRLSYDDPADAAPPKDQPVYLVSYSSDDKIAVTRQASDAEGRITFSGLDVSGATAYFAMTLLPRGASVERLLSGPLLPPGGAGLAMVLSAEKRDSAAPPVDDLVTVQRLTTTMPPAGQVVIELQGAPEERGAVVLRDASNGAELVRAAVALEVPQGAVEQAPVPTAKLDVAKLPAGTLVYAETAMLGQTFRSLPFQLTADRGAFATLLVGPRVMMRFSLTSAFDEDFFVFRGRFSLSNNSWFPYKESEDGLLFPLPLGFKGAQVTEEDANEISPVPDSGLRLLRPLPPGGRTFIAGWSMPAKAGEISWDLALPYGTVQSGMEIMQLPGMTVDLPPGVSSKTAKVAQGSFLVLPEISIRPNARMVMTIRGLPAGPAWKRWAPRLAGALVVLLLIGGVAFAFVGSGARAASQEDEDRTGDKRKARIEALMTELVALEGSADRARRDEVMAELERLWPDAAASEHAAGKAST